MQNKEFSWFLGWLFTDGSIVNPSYRFKGDESHISFCLQYSDNEVLHKIKNILQTKAKVRLYPNYKSPQCQINIYDRKDIIFQYYNIKNEYPSDVLDRHYIRGAFDGDGTLYYRENRNSFSIKLYNTNIEMLEKISKILSNKLFIDYKAPKCYRTDSPVYLLEWEGKIARYIAWYLYHGDIENCVLERKYNYYKKYILFNQQPESKAEELFIALGYQGQYFINRKNNGIVIHMNCKSKDSLIWSKRLQNIIKNSTPIPISKGQTKYYALYIPTTNMQDIEINIS